MRDCIQTGLLIVNSLILLVYLWIACSTRKQTKILLKQWDRLQPRVEFFLKKHEYKKKSKKVTLLLQWRGPGLFLCDSWWYDDGKFHKLRKTKYWNPPKVGKNIPGYVHIELPKKIFENSESVWTENKHENKRRYDIDKCTLREIRCLLLDEIDISKK